MISARRPVSVLKWAGGKRQLLPQLRRFYPATFSAYLEPFMGSGAVFFDLWARGALANRRVVLSDANADLIGMYLRLADSTNALISELETLAHGHQRDGRAHYYAVRDTRFNPARAEWRAASIGAAGYPVALAAMLIYLNRTGYNGLFRLNREGGFNVPAGRYDAPAILDVERIRVAAEVLASPGVTVQCAPFEHTLARLRRGDFVYLDPPYAPLSTTSSFRSYTTSGFLDTDQARLRDAVVAAARKGASILLSNSTASSIVALYDDSSVRGAGLRCLRVPARRAINSRASGRGVIEELLVTNLPENA